MTSPASPAPNAAPAPDAKPAEGSGGSRPPRERLADACIEEMREWVEGSDLPYWRIAEAMGVSPATVSRYAVREGWRRPPGAGLPAGRRRDRLAQRLWRLTERHAQALEDQPIEVAGRSLQPLARLIRILGDMDKHAPLPEPPPASEDPRQGRTIHELRDELVAHLERISNEFGYGWEESSWWFEHGGGI